MKTVPTAEEFFKTEYSIMDSEYPEMGFHIKRKVLEFAKLHVQAALKALHRKNQIEEEDLEWSLDAYPLNNIQ